MDCGFEEVFDEYSIEFCYFSVEEYEEAYGEPFVEDTTTSKDHMFRSREKCLKPSKRPLKDIKPTSYETR